MAEEEIDLVKLREETRAEIDKEWELASQTDNSFVQDEFQKHLDIIAAEGISEEEYKERAVDARMNDMLNSDSEE